MSTKHVNDTAGSMDDAGQLRQAPMACEGPDLKRILAELANQIADADSRHTKALASMQERLGALGATAQELRDQLPADMAPALDRIQGGMYHLADRLAEVETHRRPAGSEAAIQPGPQPPAKPVETPLAEAAPVEIAPALRSALDADARDVFAKRSQIARTNAANPDFDHFDVVDSSPAQRDVEAWDPAAADALARLYETGFETGATEPADLLVPAPVATQVAQAEIEAAAPVAVPPPVEPFAAVPAAAHSPQVIVAGPSTAEIASEVAARQAHVMENERLWLDGRFADIAARLEQSIAGISADRKLETIDARFVGLESKLAEALAAAPTRSDLSGLMGIENQVEDLAAQLVAVQTHFSRLDTIELELRSLAERVSTEELAKLMEANAPRATDSEALAGAVASRIAMELPHFDVPRLEQALQSLSDRLSADKIAALVGQSKPSQPDAGAIAKMVADLVSQQMPRQAAASADQTPRFDELRHMFESFATEQRHGDEQINTMLDTMQQAMIRLLDRMDAIEQARYAEPDAHYAAQPGGPQGYADANGLGAQHEQRTYATQHADYGQPPAYRDEPGPAPMHQHQYAPQAAPGMAYEPAYQPQNAPPADSRPQHEQSGPRIAPKAEAAPAGDSREDFIAAARRAARKAAEAQPEPGQPESEVDARVRKVPVQPAPKKARRLSGVSMALLSVAVLGGSFAAAKMLLLTPKQAAQPQKQSGATTPSAAPREADQRVRNLDDADGVNEGVRQPAGQQRRSSIDDRDDRASVHSTASLQGAPSTPAALTMEQPGSAIAPRPANPMPPAAIGPNSLRSAAAKGDPSAEYEIGVRFAEAKGVPQDLQQAVAWYRRAASQGFAPAQYRLGSMYERGLGLKADLARARVWYQRAAEQGIVKAMHNLAVLTAGRDNAATDYTQAAHWFKAAADHGLTDSQFNLAIMHDSGLGMERDPVQAYKWFALAARAGDAEASRRRDALRAKLAPRELAQVDAELNSWRPKQSEQTINDPRLAGEIWKQR